MICVRSHKIFYKMDVLNKNIIHINNKKLLQNKQKIQKLSKKILLIIHSKSIDVLHEAFVQRKHIQTAKLRSTRYTSKGISPHTHYFVKKTIFFFFFEFNFDFEASINTHPKHIKTKLNRRWATNAVHVST